VVAEGVVAGEGFAADAGADSGPLAARAVCVVAKPGDREEQEGQGQAQETAGQHLFDSLERGLETWSGDLQGKRPFRSDGQRECRRNRLTLTGMRDDLSSIERWRGRAVSQQASKSASGSQGGMSGEKWGLAGRGRGTTS